MSKLLTSINVDESGVSSLKFVKNGGVLICGHAGGISYYSSRDYFQERQTVELPDEKGQVTCLDFMQGKLYCGGFSGNVSVFEFRDA